MRPVNRGASGTYPADFNHLTLSQRSQLISLQKLLFGNAETLIQECISMANQLGTIYRIAPRAKRARSTARLTRVEITEGDWKTYDDLESQVDNARNDFNNRPNPATPADEEEKDSMILLYQRLMGIAERKKSAIREGMNKLSADYGRARRQLINNIGQYCSYCEMPLATSLAVEHMLPKSDFPLLALVWENFLLACPLCNSYKNSKPTRTTGIRLAILPGLHAACPPTDQQESLIQNAARNSYLWPNDATNYTAFQNYYQYQMFKVIYDKQGILLRTPEAIPHNKLIEWIQNNQIEFNEDSGNAVTAKVKDLLTQFDAIQTTQIQQDWDSGFYNHLLLAQLKANRLVLDPAIVSMGKIVRRVIDASNIEIIERRSYWLSFTGSPNQKTNVEVIECGKDQALKIFDISLSKEQHSKFRSLLLSGRIPTELATKLAEPNYKIDTYKDVFFAWPDNNDFYIETDKTYLLRKDNGSFKLFNTSNVQVELHLAAAATPLSNKAKQVIDDLKLNHVDASLHGTKHTDRRMVKRTRTWFIAIESLRRIDHAINNGIDLTPLLTVITETVKATGFWSVWRTVFSSISSTSPHRDTILAIFSDQNNFPGTR